MGLPAWTGEKLRAFQKDARVFNDYMRNNIVCIAINIVGVLTNSLCSSHQTPAPQAKSRAPRTRRSSALAVNSFFEKPRTREQQILANVRDHPVRGEQAAAAFEQDRV